MSGETMKPFITPTSAEHFNTAHAPMRCQRNRNLLAIGLGATCIILATVLVGIAIWHTIRISELETNVKTLNRVVESMRVRLGLNYLDDLEDFQKEYSKVFIDIPHNGTNSDDEDDIDDDADLDEEEADDVNIHDDDDDDDDDDDEDDDFYTGEYTDVNYEDLDLDALVSKFTSYDSSEDDDEDDSTHEEDHNASDDDNLFEDFEKFQDSKKKLSVRKTRSISNVSNGLPHYVDSYLAHINKTASDFQKESPEQPQQVPKLTSMRSKDKTMDAAHNTKGSHKRQFVSERAELKHHSPLRPRSHRRRKIPITKSAKSMDQTHLAISVLPAAHFHLNRKVPDRHAAIRVDSYPGDMYIGAPSSTNEHGYERYFRVENGVLTIREPGLYYIYAQVCYNNTHDQNGFVIFHGHKPFLQCLNTVPTNMPLKIHTCHTSGLIHLHTDETIHLRDFHSDRNVILKDSNNRSYFGLIKV